MPASSKVVKRNAKVSFLRLTPFQRGLIVMAFSVGMNLNEIADDVQKADGTHPSVQAVADTVQYAEDRGGKLWDGEIHGDAGRPRETTSALDNKIIGIVFKKRGSIRVTAGYVQRVVKEARGVSTRTIQRRLADAGLRFSGRHPDYPIMQVLELDQSAHPFFTGAQFHPELTSRPLQPCASSSR